MTEEHDEEETVIDDGPDPEDVLERRAYERHRLSERMYENWLEGLKDKGGR